MGSIWSFLHLKEVNKIEIDSIERSLEHRKIIEKKTFLNSLYIEWYTKIKKNSNYNEYGNFLELGSGAGFIKKIMPNVVTSDVINISGLDKIIFANNIPFENKSLDAIIMVDVFHHIPNVREFLNEADRVLKTDGVIVMSEPWNSIFGRFIYTYFHHEPFKVNSVWELANQGPLSSANGALPWIVFDRDKVIFEKEFPNLKIEKIVYHTPFRYLLSGGVSVKQLVPAFSYKFFTMIDNLFSSKFISMFAYIIIRKKK